MVEEAADKGEIEGYSSHVVLDGGVEVLCDEDGRRLTRVAPDSLRSPVNPRLDVPLKKSTFRI